jgi:outer membrane protein, heavy metal efflux system
MAFRIVVLFLLVPAIVPAQQAMSRRQAIDAALSRGPRLAVARADTLAARAQLLTAGALPNPSLSTSYSKDPPQYHIIAALPLDVGAFRSARIQSAEAARLAAALRFQYDRAAITFDADTTYTRVLAAAAHAQLSRRNAQDADSLRRIAEIRRDAGDASDLEVQLAAVNAGQQLNAAIADSLVLIAALLDLQAVVGASIDQVGILPSDSLAVPPPDDGASTLTGTPLLIASAEASLVAAQHGRRAQQRSVWTLPTIEGGVEFLEPGVSRAMLPTIGLSFPMPLLSRNEGPILAASAELDRARAELDIARLESRVLITRSLREREIALGRVARDRQLLDGANRVVAMSIRAYQEGAAPLANVLEAQRTTREVLGQYIDDVAAAWIAVAAVRLHTLTSSPQR